MCLLLLIFSSFSIYCSESIQKLLKEIEYRYIPECIDFNWKMKVFYNDGYISETKFIAKKNGASEFMFYTIYPNRSFGNVYLRIDNSIWEYFPLADVTTRSVLKNNILNSNLSYFDILFDDLINNYTGKIQECNKEIIINDICFDCLCIELECVNQKMNQFYPKVLLYVDCEKRLPIQREYFSSDNKKLKTVTFMDYTINDNKIMEFSMKIENEFNQEKYTVATFSNINGKEVMEKKYFTLGFLKNWIPDMELLK